MTKKFKSLSISLMIAFLLTTISCQVEENTVTNKTSNTSFKVKRINKTEISNFPKALEKIEAINNSTKTKKTTSKIVNDTILDIVIDTNEAILIEDENYTSLTFPIFRSNSNDFENLVVYTTGDVTNTYIVNYGDNLDSTLNGQNNIASITQISFDTSTLNDRIEIRNTVTTIYSDEFGSLNYYCEETWQIDTEYGYMDVANPSTGTDTEELINSNCYHMYTFNISNGGGGGIGGSSSNNHGQLGAGGAGGSVTTSPITGSMEYQLVKDFVKGLNPDQLDWWTNPNNDNSVESISNYLSQIDADPILAEELIDLAIENNLEFYTNNYTENFDFDNVNDFENFIEYEEIDNTLSTTNPFVGGKIITNRNVKLSPLHQLTLEIVITPSPNFDLDESNSTSYFTNDLLPGNSWTQTSIIVTDDSLTSDPNSAEITISGYINVGVKVGDYVMGVKRKKRIIIRIRKNDGVIYYTEVRNLN